MQAKEKHYGLFTAISMIVGICVGSGIFFKADNILTLTNGNVALSILVFIIAALCVITGAMSISQLATRSNETGGVVAYFDEFISKDFGNGFGWFYLLIYYPTITAVVSWVAGIYTLQLFGFPANLLWEILIAVAYVVLLFAMNYLSLTMAGRFQNLTTIGKLIPLVGIGLVSFFLVSQVDQGSARGELMTANAHPLSWLAALTPMVFSYEGWIVATGISNEIKDAKKNIPLALFFGPIIVLLIYLAYFIGLVRLAGVDAIVGLGDGVVSVVGQNLLGAWGDKILTFFILLAVVGVVNGMILGFIRLPQALALKGIIPYSQQIKEINFQRGLSLASTLVAFALTLVWLGIHYVVQRFALLGHSDVSEIAIIFNYIGYILLYAKVIQLCRKGEISNRFMGIVIPSLAILGSLVIIGGGYLASPQLLPIFILICLGICLLGYFYGKKARQQTVK